MWDAVCNKKKQSAHLQEHKSLVVLHIHYFLTRLQFSILNCFYVKHGLDLVEIDFCQGQQFIKKRKTKPPPERSLCADTIFNAIMNASIINRSARYMLYISTCWHLNWFIKVLLSVEVMLRQRVGTMLRFLLTCYTEN